MYALQTALGCFESALNVCSPDMLLKVGATYPEMAAQEKALDSLIHLAKKDQLDENVPMDALEKCAAYFSTMFTVLFGESTIANQARMVVNGTRSLGSTCDAITTEATAVKTLLDGEGGDIGIQFSFHPVYERKKLFFFFTIVGKRMAQEFSLE